MVAHDYMLYGRKKYLSYMAGRKVRVNVIVMMNLFIFVLVKRE